MSLISFAGLSQKLAQNIYSKNKSSSNGEEYVLSSTKKEVQIHILDQKLDKGEISKAEYNAQVAAIKNAPKVVSVGSDATVHKNTRLSSVDNLKQSAEKTQKFEIEKLKKLHENGDISDFAFKTNMYLLTTMPDTAQSSSFNVVA